MRRQKRAFTIVELLVVIGIIVLLMAILLPAVGKARDRAKVTQSKANLRNLAVAHATYASEWNDRQITLCKDNLSSYGTGEGTAYQGYAAVKGTVHPPVLLGWNDQGMWGYWMDHPGNWGLCQPIVFADGPSHLAGFGAFRIPNCKQFNAYVGGRYYDPVFYAPKDTVVIDCVDACLDDPGEFCNAGGSEHTYWSSYCLSPAAMFSPDVMANPEQAFQIQGGVHHGAFDPWALDAGFRSPSMGQCLYADLKTHMLEHQWLQNGRRDCNPYFDGGTYDDREPYYFNHSRESVPMTLFYDGHIEGLGVEEAMACDSSHRAQVGWGLWSRQDVHFGDAGYFIDQGYRCAGSQFIAETSFHVLTTDGIRGRDKFGD